jgi:hypothetical protein
MKVDFNSNDDDSYLPRFDASGLFLGGEKFQRRRCIEDMATIVVTISTLTRKPFLHVFDMEKYDSPATANQHPPGDHPLDARYYSVVDEPQLPHLSLYLVSPW